MLAITTWKEKKDPRYFSLMATSSRIYEHFPGIETRYINLTYKGLLPRAFHIVIGCHLCKIGFMHMQVDGFTHVKTL